MGKRSGRHLVEWMRTRNPWATSAPWARTHAWRMYALGAGARWVQPPARFLIVTPGRTGSELLTDLLDSHPGIVCEAEILRPRMAFPERFVDGRASKAGLGGASAYGFKIHCGHFGYQVLRERPQFLRHLSDRGVHVILLRRDNYLAQAISSTIALRTRWHWRRGDGAVFQPQDLDPVEVLMMTYLFEESDHYLADLVRDLPHLRLTYDQDLREPAAQQATVGRICQLLGVPAATARSDHVRFTPRRFSSTVANLEELAAVIRPTRFRRFLDEEDQAEGSEPPQASIAPADHPLAGPASRPQGNGAAGRAGDDSKAGRLDDAPTTSS